MGNRRKTRTLPTAAAIALVALLLALWALPALAQDYVATGAYTGDGAAGQVIAGLGFAPDLVIVKAATPRHAYCRTATMGPGLSKSLGNADDIRTDRIVSLDADGFTIGGNNEVNDAGVAYTWVALRASSGLLNLGSYVGSGAAFRFVGGPAFTPAAVLVLGENNKLAVLRTGTMPLSTSLPLAGGEAYDDRILNLADGGFHVGGTDEVNKAGELYHFIAWAEAPGITMLGNYNGNGNSRVIDEVGFTPAWLVVASIDNMTAVHRAAALGGGDVTQFFSADPNGGDLVTSLTADGFTVGGADAVNANASNYHWLALQSPGSIADLSVTAAAAPPAPAVGDTVRFVFGVTNGSPVAATNVDLAVGLESGLDYVGHQATAGAFDPQTGAWSLARLDPGLGDTLTVVTTVAPGQEGRELAGAVAARGADQADPEPQDNDAKATVVVAIPSTDGLLIQPLPGEPAGVRPGEPALELLTFLLVNVGSAPDTLRGLRITNLTPGPGSAAQLDAEWDKLELTVGPAAARADLPPATAVAWFAGGTAAFAGLAAAIAPGDTLRLAVRGGPALTVRDGIPMRVGVAGPADVGVTAALYGQATWPLTTGQRLTVDGFVAAQAAVHQVPYGLLAVGSADNLVFDVSLPANGHLDDVLYGFNLVNLGSAAPGTDIARLKAWRDDGDGVFSPTTDAFLGQLVNSGERWQLTGLASPVPAGGVRAFFTVDVAETAQPAREIRLALPVVHGPGVEMLSGNDGPVDRVLENANGLGISVSDRVIITAGAIEPAVVHPGSRSVPLLDLVLTNTYTEDHTLQTLAVTNATVGAAGATIAQLDSTVRQVTLRLDGDDDGRLDDLVTDPSLGTVAFEAGRAVFQGLNLSLTAGTSRRLFVAGDVSLVGAADGDRLAAIVVQGSDVLIERASVVANWPLDSGADARVDGMVREQVVLQPVPVQSLGPSAVDALALDLLVPDNGYRADELLGLTVHNRHGSAGPADLAAVQLWHDGGNGFFDAGSLDDGLLGTMTWVGGNWVSPVLGRPVPRGGLRLYVSVDVSSTPADSSVVRLAVPVGGILVASGNSGPLDRECVASGSLVLSTSPLHSTVVFTTAATTVGQAGQVRMSVHNSGAGPVFGVTPSLQGPNGDATLSLGNPAPASRDIGVGQEVQFVWDFTATGPGTATLAGGASGQGGGGEIFASVPTTTPAHTVYTPATGLELYPVTNLPASVNRGQAGLVPLTLTLDNPGAATVADALLTHLRLRLTETPGGPGIVPASLLSRLVVGEGTNVYAALDTVPATGQDIDVVLQPPVRITGSEPVSLGVRMDLLLNATAPSFVVSLEDATCLTGLDAVSGAGVPVTLANGSFPVRTGQANLVTPAGSLQVSVPAGPARTAAPGQAAVVLAEFALANPGSGPSSSAITVDQLAFALQDTFGATVTGPAARFPRVTLRSAYQVHFQGPPAVLGDTLMVLSLSTPAIIGSDAAMTLELLVDVDADAPLGVCSAHLADPDRIRGQDANTGAPVPVILGAERTGPRLAVLGAPAAPTATGAGRLPATVSAGQRSLPVMDLALTHPGGPGASPVALDSLVFTLLDGGRRPLDPAAMLDRVRVLAGAAVLGDLVDPAGPPGRLAVPLGGVGLAPGQTLDLSVQADLLPGLTGGACEFVLAAADIRGHATTDASPVAGAVGGGAWPLSSGLARVVVPAEELSVGGSDLMPPLLAPASEPYPVLALTVRNTASPDAGDIALGSLTVSQPAAKTDAVDLGRALAAVVVLRDGAVVAATSAIDPAARTATAIFAEPLIVPAAATTDLVVAVTVRAGAPTGTLTLQVDEAGFGAGLPGAPPGGIRIVPASGASLPLRTAAGTLAAASLDASYLNFPNPFAAGREATTFAFALAAPGRVTLRLYTPHGEPVATVIAGEDRAAGFYQRDTWDGINGRGEAVHNGVYLAEIVVEYAGGTRERFLRKVAVVR